MDAHDHELHSKAKEYDTMVDNLKPDQVRALLELRNQMMHELPSNMCNDDVLLYKFLKARNFNLKKTEIMLRNHLRFRKELQIDTLLNSESCEVLQKFLVQSFLGFDKEGCPVRYCPLGNIDGIGLSKSINYYNALKHSMRFIETDKELQKEQSKKLGKPIYQSIYIFDLDKLTFAQATHRHSISLFLRGAMVFQDNYPEMIKKMFLINVSTFFTIPWPFFKSFLAPNLVEKIHVYGQSDWKNELLKYIDSDILPAFLGGNRTDPDGNPMCLTFISRGGKVPEKCYYVKNIEKTAHKRGMKHVTLRRQTAISIPIYISKSMSVLNWEFETKCHDVGFGLTFEASKEVTSEELIPVHKQDTENGPMCGMFRCDKIGKYAIVFDNSYSWFNPKDIYFRTWVTNSTDIE